MRPVRPGLFGTMRSGTLALALVTAAGAHAQIVEDGSDAALGKAEAGLVRDLVARHLGGLDPKVTDLRRVAGGWICGAVNVKNRDGLYLGERGFVVDPSDGFFGRVPEGPELLNPRAEGFAARERVRQLFFTHCLE